MEQMQSELDCVCFVSRTYTLDAPYIKARKTMLLCPVPGACTFGKWSVRGPIRTASAPLFPIAPPWYPSGYCLDTFFTDDGAKKTWCECGLII